MKARQAKSSNEVLMVELDQLRYERSQAAASAEAMRRDMSQMQHDLHIGQELNAQLQSDLAATRDDQVWGGGEELELSRWWVLFVGAWLLTVYLWAVYRAMVPHGSTTAVVGVFTSVGILWFFYTNSTISLVTGFCDFVQLILETASLKLVIKMDVYALYR